MSSSVMIPLNNISSKIEILQDEDEHPWFKRAHLGEYVGLKYIHTSTRNMMWENNRKREGFPTCQRLTGWVGDKNSQNKTDIFLSLTAALHVVMRCDKKEAIPVRDWLIKEIIPRGLNKVIEEKQQAIENMSQEHQLAIEDKDNALALLNDDLDESQREYAILEYRYEQLEARAVPYLEDPKKDNGMAIIQKNNGDEYPYYSICGQHIYRKYRKRDKMVSYPQGQVVLDCETPNAIVHYNWLKESGYIIPDPTRPRHFRLGRNMLHQELLGIQDA